MRRVDKAAVLLLTTVITAAAQEPLRRQRLENLADIWGQVYAFHPKLMAEEIDWRGAFLTAIPKVEAAENTQAYVAAINEMLSKLDDPLTAAQITPPLASPGPAPAARLLAPGIGYLDLTEARHYVAEGFDKLPRALIEKLGAVERLVVDLRWRSIPPEVPISEAPDEWLTMFYTHPVRTRGWVRRMHEGWEEQGRSDVSYGQRWTISPGTVYRPSRPLNLRATFLVNYPSAAVFQEQLDALQSCGHIVVLEQSGATHGSTYPESVRFASPGSMIVSQTGALGFKPDAVKLRIDDLIAASAVEKQAQARQAFSPTEFRFPAAEPVKTDLTREERIYGLLKLWFVLTRFFPGVVYATPGWPETMKNFIPRVEAAPDFRQYYDALIEWTAPLNDSHVVLTRETGLRPRQFVPAQLDYVEGKVIVLRVASGAGDLQRGDEIVAIDGRSIPTIESEWRHRISSSTEGAFRRFYAFGPLFGPKDSEVMATIIRSGVVKTVTLRRTSTAIELVRGIDGRSGKATAAEEPFRILEDNIGYIDLNRLGDERKLDDAFRVFNGTRGLILDMRGHPHGIGVWELASRLATRPFDTHRYEIPLNLPPDPTEGAFFGQRQASIRYQRRIYPHPTVHYDNPVVLLINSTSQSAAETLALFARESGRVTIVGSRSAGTTGGVEFITIPGGAKLRFTGALATLADGSRFQNIGVEPDVYVEPTVAGVLANRDEILEKGREVLEDLIKRQ